MSRNEVRIYNNKIRRQRERRKNITITVAAFCLVTILSILANGFFSNAQTGYGEVVHKYYKSIVIESGDTLWTIAAEYKIPDTDTKSFMDEIKKVNGLHSDHITAGNYLIIPYYSSEGPITS